MNCFVSPNPQISRTHSNHNYEHNNPYYNHQNQYRIEEGIEVIEERVAGCCCLSTLWSKDCNIYRV